MCPNHYTGSNLSIIYHLGLSLDYTDCRLGFEGRYHDIIERFGSSSATFTQLLERKFPKPKVQEMNYESSRWHVFGLNNLGVLRLSERRFLVTSPVLVR